MTLKLFHVRSQKGFTLIELLISMAIGLSIMGVLGSTFTMQRDIYGIQEQIMEAVQTARASMDMMTREIRMAGYDPTGVGINGITYDTSQLRILADLNGDGATTGPNEDITYAHFDETDQIKRKTGNGYFQPFAESIQTFTFSYLNSALGSTSATADIRAVRIRITARTEKPDPDYPDNNGYRTMTLAGYVTPPNLAFP